MSEAKDVVVVGGMCVCVCNNWFVMRKLDKFSRLIVKLWAWKRLSANCQGRGKKAWLARLSFAKKVLLLLLYMYYIHTCIGYRKERRKNFLAMNNPLHTYCLCCINILRLIDPHLSLDFLPEMNSWGPLGWFGCSLGWGEMKWHTSRSWGSSSIPPAVNAL